MDTALFKVLWGHNSWPRMEKHHAIMSRSFFAKTILKKRKGTAKFKRQASNKTTWQKAASLLRFTRFFFFFFCLRFTSAALIPSHRRLFVCFVVLFASMFILTATAPLQPHKSSQKFNPYA